MKQRLYGAALTAALLFPAVGASSASLETPKSYETYVPMPVTHTEIDNIDNDFKVLKNYWSAKTAGMATVRLTQLEGDTKMLCDPHNPSSLIRPSTMMAVKYCFLQHTVVASETGMGVLLDLGRKHGVSIDDVTKLVLAHEIGHGVQDAKGDLHRRMSSEEALHIELQADCYAGRALHNVFSDTVASAPAFYSAITPAPDSTHGTSAMRTEQFESGAHNGIC